MAFVYIQLLGEETPWLAVNGTRDATLVLATIICHE